MLINYNGSKFVRTLTIASFTLTTLIFSTTIHSCYDCGDNKLKKLSDSIKDWLPYTQGDQFVFENGVDESQVTIYEYTEGIESYFRGDECGEGTMEVVTVRLISNSFNDTLILKLEQTQRLLFENINFELIYHEGNKAVYPIEDENRRYETSINVNNKIYTDVLISNCNLCDSLSEIIFSKKRGLVAYKLKDSYWTIKD